MYAYILLGVSITKEKNQKTSLGEAGPALSAKLHYG
jgi:hypothetical protein